MAGRLPMVACIFEAALAAASGVANTSINLPPIVFTTRPPVDSATSMIAEPTALRDASCRVELTLGSANRTVATLFASMTLFYRRERGPVMNYWPALAAHKRKAPEG